MPGILKRLAALTLSGTFIFAAVSQVPGRPPVMFRAKRFLVDLQSSIRILRQPDVAKYFTPANVATAKTVGNWRNI